MKRRVGSWRPGILVGAWALAVTAGSSPDSTLSKKERPNPPLGFRADFLESTWVHVFVSKHQDQDQVVYRFRLRNGPYGLSAFAVGMDAYSQRTELPMRLQEASCAGPWGWKCEWKPGPAGEPGYFLWQSSDGFNTIEPGGEMTCFSLRLPKEEPLLERCHWTAYTNVHVDPRFSGTLLPDTERPPVQVLVTKSPGPSGVEYRYRILNGSAYPITSLWVGNEQHCSVSGEVRILDAMASPGTHTSPPGWTFDFIPTEEDSMGAIRWEMKGQDNELMGGRELSGFSVIRPAEESAYESGHWTVMLNTGLRSHYTGALEPDGDTRPPASSSFGGPQLQKASEPGKVAITFLVPIGGSASLKLLDQHGTPLGWFRGERFTAGENVFLWDEQFRAPGSHPAGKQKKIPPGTYFLRLEVAGVERFVQFKWPQ